MKIDTSMMPEENKYRKTIQKILDIINDKDFTFLGWARFKNKLLKIEKGWPKRVFTWSINEKRFLIDIDWTKCDSNTYIKIYEAIKSVWEGEELPSI